MSSVYIIEELQTISPIRHAKRRKKHALRCGEAEIREQIGVWNFKVRKKPIISVLCVVLSSQGLQWLKCNLHKLLLLEMPFQFLLFLTTHVFVYNLYQNKICNINIILDHPKYHNRAIINNHYSRIMILRSRSPHKNWHSGVWLSFYT